MDYSSTSKSALKWTANNLLKDGDHLVLIHVQPPNSDTPTKLLFQDTGSPLIPLEEFGEIKLEKQYGLSNDAEVKVMAKVYWGDPREKLCEAVDDLNLHSLVLGSRGLGSIKKVLLGSVSNYVVKNASCPVTVVKGKPLALSNSKA
ncbi:universal stress protein A-like protein [Cucumis melo var. makuwa]|uniref:Universal stress protein A-like protein n=1 Tax=Cucumis melo var. makuwa TaxID=1194695 RepID=A0A5D3D5Z6_CUCMM|nr:universal stress protein A-like protein [Cucumis melo var. makuwa]